MHTKSTTQYPPANRPDLFFMMWKQLNIAPAKKLQTSRLIFRFRDKGRRLESEKENSDRISYIYRVKCQLINLSRLDTFHIIFLKLWSHLISHTATNVIKLLMLIGVSALPHLSVVSFQHVANNSTGNGCINRLPTKKL